MSGELALMASHLSNLISMMSCDVTDDVMILNDDIECHQCVKRTDYDMHDVGVVSTLGCFHIISYCCDPPAGFDLF